MAQAQEKIEEGENIARNPAQLEGTVMIEGDRYKRQMILWGEAGQKRLMDSRVAIVGLGAQGVYSALCCAALGIGKIVLIDGKNSDDGEMFLDRVIAKGQRASAYPELIGNINKQISVEGYPTDLESRIDQEVLSGADVIIDATNSIRSKQYAFAYAKEKGIPMLSTSSRWGYAKAMLCTDAAVKDSSFLMPMFEGTKQDELMALVMCGVIAEEVRKLIFKEKEQLLEVPVRYRLGKGYRFGFPKEDEEAPVPEQKIYENLKVAFLGGGAIGCWAAVAGAKLGFGTLDVFDYDIFEPHNINRQILGFDGIGKLKSVHVAEKISRMSKGKTSSTGFNQMITPGFTTEKKYGLVFDFVDNAYTRAINTAYAIANKVPMISAGALPSSARVITQVEGATSCQDCVYDIYQKGMQDEMIRRASCAANPNPSVVMSNAIAGALAMLETYSVFEPGKFGEPFNGEYTYRASNQKRFGSMPLNSPCGCYSKIPPDLAISQKDVEEFIAKNPQLLQEQR